MSWARAWGDVGGGVGVWRMDGRRRKEKDRCLGDIIYCRFKWMLNVLNPLSLLVKDCECRSFFALRHVNDLTRGDRQSARPIETPFSLFPHFGYI